MIYHFGLRQWFSSLSTPQNYLEGLLKHRFPGPPGVSESGGLGSPRICFPNKFPGDAEAVGNHTVEPLP